MKTFTLQKGDSKKIFLFLTILLIFNFLNQKTVYSQVYREWVQQYSRAGNIHDNPRFVGIDRNGNIICVNSPKPYSSSDVDILKYNQAGTILWSRIYNGDQDENDNPHSFCIDDSSNILIGCTANESSAGQLCDPVIVKWNTSGTLQWSALYSTNQFGIVFDLVTDASCNIYYTAHWGPNTPNIDVVTSKLSPGGSQIWSTTWVVPGQREDGGCIARDASGNVYIAGATNLPSATDIFLKKYSPLGAELWSVTYNGPQNKCDYVGTGVAGRIALDAIGNIYIIGFVNEDNIWGGGGDVDIVLLKYNNSGVMEWSRFIKGSANDIDWPGGIAIDKQNNIFITGNCKNAVSGNDGFLAKYNSNGDSVWVKRNNGTANDYDGFSEPVLDILGNVYVGGSQQNSNQQAIIYKYDSAGMLAWSQFYSATPDSSDYFITPAIDSSGNVFCTGGSYHTATDIDMVLVKYLQPPYNPENLSATAVSGSSINLNWSDAAGNENGFKIERTTNGGVNWILKDSVSANVLFYSDSGLISNSIYSYRIYGYNDAGNSIYSNTALDTTFSTSSILELTVLIEGFYNSTLNEMVRDTIKVFLHNNISPYSIVDSASAYVSSKGSAALNFTNAANGVEYFVSIKHRNSIETWSKYPGQSFSSSYLSYNFTTASSQAFGNNQTLKGDKYCIINGDVDQDGTIDATDISAVENDATGSLTGYVITDIDGDNFVDASDLSLVENNVGVNVITP